MKEFPSEKIERVLERFTESGLLDDKRFALNFARAKLTDSSASPRRVRQHLARKGIPADLAEEAVQKVILDEEIDTEESLRKVAQKKFEGLSRLDPQVQRRRLYGFLARRGYDLDDIRRAVHNILRATERAE